MPLVKPCRHRVGNEYDHRAEASQAHEHQQSAGHDGANGEIFRPVFGVNAVKDDDERAGRAADGNLGAAEARK